MFNYIKKIHNILNLFRIFEFSHYDNEYLPAPPNDDEKYMYVSDGRHLLLSVSLISFIGVMISLFHFLINNPAMWPLSIIMLFTLTYFLISTTVNIFTKRFDLRSHEKKVEAWKPKKAPSIDIFLPVAGEPLPVLANTWRGVRKMSRAYGGEVNVYVLDDGDLNDVRVGAKIFGFHYMVRPNRGYFKKAGNLRHGFENSDGDFIVIFDADFVPRVDFLTELLPYFENPKVGLVQSPQYFDVHTGQNWLERGAGAVQELFYRYSQVARQTHDASICVGSNAIYRRKALNDIGGTTLIEHSEDVYTGFNLRKEGWKLEYVPIIVAKGLCPSSMSAFFKQQYRWCAGSLSLMSSKEFWEMHMNFRTRLSYISGFAHYIYTALTSFYAPVVPLILLTLLPNQISILNYIFVFPSILFVYVILPLWHKSPYGIEAWSTQQVYGWAHLFSLVDSITGKSMGWVPTGAVIRKDRRYNIFRCLQIILNLIPGLIWTILATYYAIHVSIITYMPILLSGIYYVLVSLKVTAYGFDIKKLNVKFNNSSSPISA